jgi:large subunit ribosomal protein L23
VKDDTYNVVIRPLVTEKGTHQSQALNAYTFQVRAGASKGQIKQAIEKIYNVKVTKVRTSNRKGKPRRTGYTMGTTSHWKKAVVVLDENHRIDLF